MRNTSQGETLPLVPYDPAPAGLEVTEPRTQLERELAWIEFERAISAQLGGAQ